MEKGRERKATRACAKLPLCGMEATRKWLHCAEESPDIERISCFHMWKIDILSELQCSSYRILVNDIFVTFRLL